MKQVPRTHLNWGLLQMRAVNSPDLGSNPIPSYYTSDWWFICLGFLVCKMRLPHPPIRFAVSRETCAQYPLIRRQSKLCHTTTNSTEGVSRLCTRGELCSLLEHCSGPTVPAVSLPAWVPVRKNLSHTKMEQGQPHSCPLIPQ